MALVVFLDVRGAQSNRRIGMLQMVYQKGPQGQISQGWEWIGVNSTTDGGSWKWKKAKESSKVWAELTSTHDPDKPRVAARLYKNGWNKGVLPPRVPWFEIDIYEWGDDEDTLMEYYGPSGATKQYARWWPE